MRTNPRTEDIPLIILSDETVVENSMPGFLEGVLVKPLNLDEVRSHIAQVFQRSDAVREVGHESGTVSGSLAQISMADLLQVFSMNRRTGVLQLQVPGVTQVAEVYVNEGRIEEAVSGQTRGEKALYRVIGFKDGQFSFVPGRTPPSRSLDATTDMLLIEGMRQADELERLKDELPPSHARLEQIMPSDEIPPGLHPVSAAIMGALMHSARVGDLIDRSSAPDLEAYLALKSLMSAGVLRAVVDDATATGSLLTADEAFELRSRLRRIGLPPMFMGAPKLALVVTTVFDARALFAMMARWPEFEAAPGETVGSFGSLGSLTLEQGLVVDVFALAADGAMSPFSYAMSAGTISAIVVGAGADLNVALRLVEHERRAAVVFLHRASDPQIAEAPRRVILEIGPLTEQELRHAVQLALRNGATADVRGLGI